MTRRLPLSLLVAGLGLLPAASRLEAKDDETARGPRAPWAKDAAALLEGVGEVAAPGAPGTLALWGDDAFPLVVGLADGGARVPVAACGRLGQGRVAALAHSGYLDAAVLGSAGTGRLLSRLVRWAAGGAPRAKVACVGSSLAPFLAGEGFDARAVAGSGWATRLAGVAVVVLGTSDLLADDVATLSRLAQGGTGIVAAHTGWGWLQITRAASVNESPLNALMRPAGLAWTDGFAERTSPGGFLAVEPPGALTHGRRAVDALVQSLSDRDAFSAADLHQASVAATAVVRALPRDDRTIRPRIQALLRDRADRLVPTPKDPLGAKDALDRFLLAYQVATLSDVPVDRVRAHPAAASFPGAVPSGARETSRTVSIDRSVPRWHSTGLYAAPGAVLSVHLPATTAAGASPAAALRVRIGCHADGLWALASWPRVPEITTERAIEPGVTSLSSPFGGPVYVVVPEAAAAERGTVPVTIEGAVEAPLFVLGTTTKEQWKTARRAPGPWAELATSKVVLCVPSEHVRALDDPEALMRFWDRVLDADADLAGIPRERPSPERYAADVEISAGYMHSGYPIMTHLDAAPRMVDLALLSTKGDWGLFHEMGHDHQQDAWTFDGTVEVTCNLFTLYVLETVVGAPGAKGHDAFKDRDARIARHLAAGAPFSAWKADPFLALFQYAQLKDAFGWDPFRAVFAQYRALPASERPKTDDQKRDAWLTRFSRVVGKDLGPFFQAWGVPTSQAARDALRDLPPWMPPGFPPK